MIGVIGFKLKINLNSSGTILTSYIMGVKYIHAIVTIPKMYSKSLKYTVKAAESIPIPNAKTYSTNIIIGKYKIAFKFSPVPSTINTAKITQKHNNIFTKLLVTYAIGNTCLGK